MNEATTTLSKKCKAKLLKVLFLATLFLLTASGCSTYMGYDAVKYQEDIPGTKKDLKETTLDYRVDVIEISSDRKNINLQLVQEFNPQEAKCTLNDKEN